MISSFSSFRQNASPEFSSESRSVPIALTIAGSDPTSGAGIQSDLNTFATFGVYGLSVITAITAQDTSQVADIFPLEVQAIRSQCEVLIGDIPFRFLKTGMICTAESCDYIADFIRKNDLKAIVDTPFISSGGKKLMQDDAVKIFEQKILPNAYLVTPNLSEAQQLSGLEINSRSDMEQAAKSILRKGAEAVLLKGGHLPGSESPDLLLFGDHTQYWLDAPRVEEGNLHGTGCILSAAITANCSLGFDLLESVQRAKNFITHCFKHALMIGSGQRVVAMVH